MNQGLKVPFGETADGRMVSVDAVNRGLHCECCCPSCGDRLVAVHGDVYSHHFRHHNDNAHGCTETSIHKYAKQVICDAMQIDLPNPLGIMVEAEQETRLGSIIPDVFAKYDSGNTLAIEIWVAHQVPVDKVKVYNKSRQAAVEIDLRPFRFANKSEEQWIDIILHSARRTWLSPPEYIRREREAFRKEWIRKQRMHVTLQLMIAKRTERQRKDEEKAFQDKLQQEAIRQRLLSMKWQLQAQQQAYERARHKLETAALRAKEAELRQVRKERLEREMAGPDLQEMVMVHGGYDRIPTEAWTAYRHELSEWQARSALGDFWYARNELNRIEPTATVWDD